MLSNLKIKPFTDLVSYRSTTAQNLFAKEQ